MIKNEWSIERDLLLEFNFKSIEEAESIIGKKEWQDLIIKLKNNQYL